MKTYLISGRKFEHDVQHGCSQVGRSVGDIVGVGLSPSPKPRAPDLISGGAQAAEPLLPRGAIVPSGPDQSDDMTVLNGCQEDRKTSIAKVNQALIPCSTLLLPNLHYFVFSSSLLQFSSTSSSLPIQFITGHSPRAANGLLSPPLEDPVRASQSSLCDILQEKEKKTSTSTGTGASLGVAGGVGAAGTGMDHSALIHLRAKNFREKSDAHFVDVIREDR